MLTFIDMITAYIDESGNLGKGGDYFVLGAAVFDNKNGMNRLDRMVRKEQMILAKENEIERIPEIKSSHLNFKQRQRIINKIIKRADVDIYFLVAYKKNVSLLREDKPKNLVYNYFAKLLTDMIFAKYNDDFKIIFDQRCTSVKSMNSLPDYITIGAYTKHNHTDKNVEVLQRDSRTLNNLQTADIIAGTVFQAYKYHNAHFLKMLAPRIVKCDEFPKANFKGSMLKNLTKW